MNAILAFLKKAYEHKEQILLGVLVIAFVGVGFQQYRNKKGNSDDSNGNDLDALYTGGKPSGKRPPTAFEVPKLGPQVPIEKYVETSLKVDIWEKPDEKGKKKDDDEKAAGFPDIVVKSVFDPTGTGGFIAIIKTGKGSRIVKEKDQFDDFRVDRIDGVRNCLTIVRRTGAEEEKKEFCKEE